MDTICVVAFGRLYRTNRDGNSHILRFQPFGLANAETGKITAHDIGGVARSPVLERVPIRILRHV